jgi:rhodanese-related sulfurtransferase
MDLLTLMKQPGATLVDVRETFEFQGEHAEGAINIPLGEVMMNLDRFRNMSGPILMYCRSGNRSGFSTSMLQAQGIENVFNIGGLDEVLYAQSMTKPSHA